MMAARAEHRRPPRRPGGDRGAAAVRPARRGSALLLVLALLAIVGTLGACLLLMARLDRQTTQATADAAQAESVVDGVLASLLAERLADLHLSAAGVPYGALDAHIVTAERQCIDYPDEDCDPALACIEPYDKAGVPTWRHISHPPGSSLDHTTDVPTTDPGLVDTDGDGVPDARLFPVRPKARDGSEYLAAVRMIDAAGLASANVANETRPAAAGQIMGAGDVALDALASEVDFQALREARDVCPFDMGDMLAVTWRRGQAGAATATGRLARCLLGDVSAVHLTIPAASRLAVPVRGADLPAERVEVNAAAAAADFPTLYRACRALLNDGRDETEVNREAAQLAVNLIDYVDADDKITAARVPEPTGEYRIYGVERQPFITETFHYAWVDPAAEQSGQLSAIELFNPYDSPIDLTDYTVINNGKSYHLSGAVPARGRLVVRSSDWGPVGPSLEIGEAFTTSAATVLCRPASDGETIAVDEVEGLFVQLPSDQPGENWRVRQRDDDPSRARYAVRVEHTYLGDRVESTRYVDSNHRVSARNNLGLANCSDPVFGPVLEALDAPRRPVYVRNGPLLNVGELATRILRIGPTLPDPQPICDSLRQGDAEIWLPLGDAPAAIPVGARPRVPLGCSLGEYLTVQPAGASPTTVQGLVNVNTAPAAVLRCLGGLNNLDEATRDALVGEILAYRDKTASPAGRDYAARPRGDPAVTGIVGLRDEPGFATAGEIAIPLTLAGGLRNAYGHTPPAAYAVGLGGSDDGLGSSAAPTDRPQGDYSKHHVLYCWLSSQITVRSDTFIVYICIQKAGSPPAGARQYVAVIDRSRCATGGQLPAVLLFAQVR
jgi:hypothetical protein